MTTLYGYFRSSAAYRVRIALNLKGLDYDQVPINLVKGEQRGGDHLARNPQGLVPTLELDNSTNLTQSLAIIEYLEEIHPAPALLPSDPLGRARVRALSYMIACEIHPLNNLRVLMRLRDQFGADETAQKEWFAHWVKTTFDPLEKALQGPETGRYCHGDTPGLADVCLYAQVWNNRRFDIPIETWPIIARIFSELERLPEFANAAPPNQPDAA